MDMVVNLLIFLFLITGIVTFFRAVYIILKDIYYEIMYKYYYYKNRKNLKIKQTTSKPKNTGNLALDVSRRIGQEKEYWEYIRKQELKNTKED